MNGTERRAAVAAWQAAAASGEVLTGAQLGDQFGRSARWGRDRIAEARQAGRGEMHLAAADERHVVVPQRQERHDTGRPDASGLPARRPWLDTTVVLVVALVAAAASYGHMLDVALTAGEPVWIARAWPITVDGLAIAALRRGEQGRRWLLLALTVSVASNVLAKYPEAVVDVAPAVSAWPPLALYGTHRLLHGRR
jgi:hypothetical protein